MHCIVQTNEDHGKNMRCLDNTFVGKRVKETVEDKGERREGEEMQKVGKGKIANKVIPIFTQLCKDNIDTQSASIPTSAHHAIIYINYYFIVLLFFNILLL